jgi:diacylglycerol O-acyltransferase
MPGMLAGVAGRLVARTGMMQRMAPVANCVVSNVPGPPFPLYLLGAELHEIIPFPPLLEKVGLVVALVSYNGRMTWGFNADYDQVPDLGDFAASIDRAFEALAAAAKVNLTSVKELGPVTPAEVPLLADGKGWDFSGTSIEQGVAEVDRATGR